jgi:hypothetical protein
VLSSIKSANNIEDKILALFQMCILTDEINMQRKAIYKEFIKICIKNPSDKMINFLKEIRLKYSNWLREIIDNEVKKGTLTKDTLEFVETLISTGESTLIFHQVEGYHKENALQSQIKLILKLTTKGT